MMESNWCYIKKEEDYIEDYNEEEIIEQKSNGVSTNVKNEEDLEIKEESLNYENASSLFKGNFVNLDSGRLIRAVKERPAIWDVKCDEYGDRQKKRQMWEEITSLFVFKTDTLRRKKYMEKALQTRWKNLRDRYTREVKQARSGSLENKKTLYIHLMHLGFLNEVLECDRTISSLDSTNIELQVEQTENNEPLIMEASTSTADSSPSGQSTPSNEKPFWKRCRSDPVESKITSALEASIAAIREAEKSNNDDLHFLLSLLPTMKCIPKHLKMMSRMEIMQVVLKHSSFPSLSPQ